MKKWFLLIFIIGIAVAYFLYSSIFNIPAYFNGESKLTEIRSNLSYDELVDVLIKDSVVVDANDLSLTAKLMSFDSRQSFPSGLYKFDKTNTVKDIITILRSGRQTPTNLTFNNLRKVEDVCGAIASQIELDSIELFRYVMDPNNLNSWGYTSENILTMFIPNTYEIFWNIGADKLVKRLQAEHDKFWKSDNREEKIEELGLSKSEVYTLASIVEKESNYKPERPRIAGVYLNRIENGIMLQADPTVVFATGEYDLRRVLNKHLAIDSPYNTYKNLGLPPGPIYMPSISSIDAVVNAENHDYIFFCAKPGYGREHAFATNLSGHNRNARVYREWLSSENIR